MSRAWMKLLAGVSDSPFAVWVQGDHVHLVSPDGSMALVHNVGIGRETQEDAALVYLSGSGLRRTVLVGDGIKMGGAGDVTSRILVQGTKEAILQDNLPLDFAITHAGETFARSPEFAAHEGDDDFDPGATLAGIDLIRGGPAFLAHAGDCRIYWSRRASGDVYLLTEDQIVLKMGAFGEWTYVAPNYSFLWPLKNEEIDTYELWRVRNYYSIVLADAWMRSKVRNGVQSLSTQWMERGSASGRMPSVRRGDRFLVCSDGLCGSITDWKRFRATLLKDEPLLDILCELEKDALNYMLTSEGDNLTAAMVEVGE